jgi:secreted Zn-dependent insulinase-like peptidase
MLNLTDRMLKEMGTAFDTEDKVSLNRVVHGLQTDLRDTSGEAVSTAFQDQKVLLTPRMHSRQELVTALGDGSNITYAKAKQAVEEARHGPFYATSLIMGNYAQEDAKALHARLMDGLGARTSVTPDRVEKVTPLVKPAHPIEIRKTNPRDGDSNHVTVYTIFVGPAHVENRVLLGLVGQIYSQVVFAELRTEKSLGYVVGGSVSESSAVITIDCYVQGAKSFQTKLKPIASTS